VQSDDTGGTASSPSRGFLQITATVPGIGAVQFVTAHLKSKLLTYPNGRFQTRDEDERARFGASALYKRAAEATSLRVHMTAVLAGTGTTTPAILLGDMNVRLHVGARRARGERVGHDLDRLERHGDRCGAVGLHRGLRGPAERPGVPAQADRDDLDDHRGQRSSDPAGQISDIAVHPTDSNTLYVTTSDLIFGEGSESFAAHHVYRTTNGGTNWAACRPACPRPTRSTASPSTR